MFDSLAGELIRKSPTEVVVDCAGVGYLVHVSLNTFAALRELGSVRLLIHPHYAENTQRLYGFAEESERTLFRLLQGVRGVGPALALNLLSHESAEGLVARLRAGDVAGLMRIKGIGRKTAERLLLELKDRLPPFLAGSRRVSPSREILLAQALTNLGLTPPAADERARAVLAEHPEEERIEELLRLALRSSAARGGA